MVVYFNGDYTEEDKVQISPFDRGFQFADGVYEVLRTYNLKYFKLKEHIERLKYSLYEIQIKNFYRFEELPDIFDRLIAENNFKNREVKVYIQITRGKAFPRAHHFPNKKTEPTVVITVSPIITNEDLKKDGIKIILEKDIRWARCDIKSIALLPNVLINQKAIENGAGEAIWLKDGFLTEGTHTNFFGVKKGKVYSYPLSDNILPGITRMLVTELCEKLKIEFVSEGIKENELSDFDEFFVAGTTTEIMPVIGINNLIINGGNPGSITKEIQNMFDKLTLDY